MVEKLTRAELVRPSFLAAIMRFAKVFIELDLPVAKRPESTVKLAAFSLTCGTWSEGCLLLLRSIETFSPLGSIL